MDRRTLGRTMDRRKFGRTQGRTGRTMDPKAREKHLKEANLIREMEAAYKCPSDSEIISEFDIFHVEVGNDDSIMLALRQLCIKHHLDATDLSCVWMSYSLRNDRCKISLAKLKDIERGCAEQSARKREKELEKIESTDPRSAEEKTIDHCRLMLMYIPDDNIEQKRKVQLELNEAIKNRPRRITKPLDHFSKRKPSSKRFSRLEAIKVVCSFGSIEDLQWRKSNAKPRKHKTKICAYGRDDDGLPRKKFLYMRENIKTTSDIFNKAVDNMAMAMKSCGIADEFEDVNAIALDSDGGTTIMGKVYCYTNGKLNPQAVHLESSMSISKGHNVRLNLDHIKQYSVFPGQISAFRGTNDLGDVFKCHEQIAGLAPDFSPNKIQARGSLQLVIAAGPFPTADNNFDSFRDLLLYVRETEPDVCILVGPFLNATPPITPDGSKEFTYSTIFMDCIKVIDNLIKSLKTQVVIVSSHKEPGHQFIYPTPPHVPVKGLLRWYQISVHAQIHHNIHFVPDPCLLDIDGVVIGVTSTDIIFQLAREEISFGCPVDRIGRLISHVINQRSFYPIYPPPEKFNLACGNLPAAEMACKPHVLILPSDLVHYIKDVHGCCCINPKFKGKGAGTFARMKIDLNNQEGPVSLVPEISCEIVKIVEPE